MKYLSILLMVLTVGLFGCSGGGGSSSSSVHAASGVTIDQVVGDYHAITSLSATFAFPLSDGTTVAANCTGNSALDIVISGGADSSHGVISTQMVPTVMQCTGITGTTIATDPKTGVTSLIGGTTFVFNVPLLGDSSLTSKGSLQVKPDGGGQITNAKGEIFYSQFSRDLDTFIAFDIVQTTASVIVSGTPVSIAIAGTSTYTALRL